MLRRLVPFAGAGLAAACLALAGPITAHATPLNGTSEECPGGQQHLGDGHHSFTNSDNNCVVFEGQDMTAFLTNSNNNLIVMGGFDNTVQDFKNSNFNTITFRSSSAFDNVQANYAFNDSLTVNGVADAIDLLGSNDNVTLNASDVNCFIFGNGISGTLTSNTPGTFGC